MKREDAFYYKQLLTLGFSDGFNEWFDSFLEADKPLSDIVLDLACCGSDINKTISLLHNYCLEQPFDEVVACDRLRLFFKEAYHSNRMSKEEVVATMYRLAINVGDPGDFDFNIDIWGSMYYLDDFHSLAKDGIISWESFDFAFLEYLDNGTPLDSKLVWKKNEYKKPTLLDKIRNIFRK